MLLFIATVLSNNKIISKFQYISCYCLSFLHIEWRNIFFRFQYISCYCLSSRTLLFHCLIMHFNTSHVTVYPFPYRQPVLRSVISIHLMLLFIKTFSCVHMPTDVFQYISCYCLSRQSAGHSDRNCIFQYISCYCLSKCGISVYVPTLDFNTSHVTVYRSILCKSTYPNYISIHLMLLFIREKEQKAEEIYYFNTSHVTVYRVSCLSYPRYMDL